MTGDWQNGEDAVSNGGRHGPQSVAAPGGYGETPTRSTLLPLRVELIPHHGAGSTCGSHDGPMETGARLVPLQGSLNFRDLGGYPTDDGRTTRWGRLYRSDTLHELTPSDVAVLLERGLRTVVDLRTARELARTGRGPLEHHDVEFRHLAVIKEGVPGEESDVSEREAVAAPAPVGDDLSARYLWYLDVGGDSLVEALCLAADPERAPLVFHCAAGKDRTGVLAALILELCGVPRDVIVADYVLTAERIGLIMDRYRADPRFAERIAKVPASRFGVEAITMERFLDRLAADFGGARQFAVDAGVPPEALTSLVDHLVGPSG